jgi:ATP-binding protein involved in chromosome partitioning
MSGDNSPVSAGAGGLARAIHPDTPHAVATLSRYRIAAPLDGGLLSPHFGHCESYGLFDVDQAESRVLAGEELIPPPHGPGLLPLWLADRGVEPVLCAGMGQRAQSLFEEHGISVLAGAPSMKPEKVVEDFLSGSLELDENVCEH